MSKTIYRRQHRRPQRFSFDTLVGLSIIFGVAFIERKVLVGRVSLITVATFLIIFIIRKAYKVALKNRFSDTDVDVQSMSGLEYEKYVAKALTERGYTKVRLTEKYDLGVDIIASKDGVTWGIQVKRCSGIVRAHAVRQVVTALNHYRCDRAMVITNGEFSMPAITLARSNACILTNIY